MNENMVEKLIERFCIELKKRDRSGIYAITQREFAYNSNKIEGSTLTKEQTASLFDIEQDVYKKQILKFL